MGTASSFPRGGRGRGLGWHLQQRGEVAVPLSPGRDRAAWGGRASCGAGSAGPLRAWGSG